MRSADMIGSNIEHLSMVAEGFQCRSSGARQRGSRGPNACRPRRGKKIATKGLVCWSRPLAVCRVSLLSCITVKWCYGN